MKRGNPRERARRRQHRAAVLAAARSVLQAGPHVHWQTTPTGTACGRGVEAQHDLWTRTRAAVTCPRCLAEEVR